MTRTGGCQCGAVRYALAEEPTGSHVCHCRMCQKATGGLFAALTGIAKDKIEWTKGAPAFFRSSSLATRGFCQTCGTPLTFAYDKPTSRLYVTIGSLDKPTTVPIERQFGIESRLPWVKFCEDVPGERTGEALPSEMAGFFDGMTNFQQE